jgi:outer membrane lipoprotein SlyB
MISRKTWKRHCAERCQPDFKGCAFVVVALLFLLSGCGAPKPVLYPNDHLKRVGEEQARRDIAACEQLAAEYVKSEAGKDTLKNTAGGAAGGAVVGGAVGAVTGRLGRGIGVGAAAGAAAGLVKSASDAGKPSPVHKQFVERCLREKGCETIGWQ